MPGSYDEPTTFAHTQPSVTTSSTAVLAANDNRVYALIINDGAVEIYLNLGGTAVANQGIRVNANGGSYEISQRNSNLFRGAINGIVASGSATALVTQGTRV